MNDAREFGEIETRFRPECVTDELGQIDAAQAAAAVRGQRLLAAGVRCIEPLAIRQVVVRVDAINEDDAGFRVIVSRAHDLVPQVARAHRPVNPQAVVALPRVLLRVDARCRFVYKFPFPVVLHCTHERVGDCDAHVEIRKIAVVFGVNEVFDVRMVAAQDAHLRTAPRARRFNRLAAAVEDAHVRNRTARRGMRAAHVRAFGTNVRKVVADTAAAPHRFSGFHQRDVNAGLAVDDLRHGIAHRLDEAVDQRGFKLGAGGRVDAAARNESADEGFEEFFFPARGILFDGGKRTGDAAPHFVGRLLGALRILLEQHIDADLLLRKRERCVIWFHVGAFLWAGNLAPARPCFIKNRTHCTDRSMADNPRYGVANRSATTIYSS